MKTELEKCLSGEWYDCHAPVFIEFKTKTHKLLLEYNALPYDAKEKKYAILKDMFENIGKNVSVGSPFVCDVRHRRRCSGVSDWPLVTGSRWR